MDRNSNETTPTSSLLLPLVSRKEEHLAGVQSSKYYKDSEGGMEVGRTRAKKIMETELFNSILFITCIILNMHLNR